MLNFTDKYITILTLIIFFGINTVTIAQVQKGDMNIGFSSSVSTESGNPINMNITGLLSIERYFTDNISVGVGPILSLITSKGSLTSVYGVNIYGNYNFLTNNGKLLPYFGILGSINQSISNNDSRADSNGNQTVSSGNTTVSFYGLGGKAGTKYFITERINLDININYATNISSKVNGVELEIGEGGQIQLFAGIGVILGKKGI
jgi:outer membrane protein W